MKSKTFIRSAVCTVVLVAGLAGCGRHDTRVNSDPGPGKPSSADAGDRSVQTDPNSPAHTTAPGASKSATTGTDSTGRPSGASGGTTGAGAGSNTSGTITGEPATPARK
jgi:hypothetical protein